MRASLYSLYWDNIDPAIVTAQKEACAALGMAVNQHRIQGLNHGEWIDWVMARMDDIDIFLFIDIDCVPLSRDKFAENLQKAAKGTLIGAEGAANHIDPTRSYAGAWYTYISRTTWNSLGRPSAKPTPYADICQNWTDVWRQFQAPVELIAPTHFITPKWDLPNRPMAYGIATTYGNDCFHLFESRSGDPQPFLDECRRIIAKG
ncbi:MAG: hypothetical protein WCD70_08325 [Alphaproteobacteria bacterium]